MEYREIEVYHIPPNIHTMKNNHVFLEMIKFLRFPLMVMVVMIHAQMSRISMGGGIYEFNVETFPIYSNISYFVSKLISRIAVPCFYLFSGYLFFMNIKRYSCQEYLQKIRKRTKTLLIPYIFWNLVVVILFFVSQTFIPSLISGYSKPIVEFVIADWLKAFWSWNVGAPINNPLWFIRDLFVVVLLSPIIYHAIKLFKFY